MGQYFYPIPKEKLVARFEPLFKCLSQNNNATLLALPYAGRSSHLRFIASQKVFPTNGDLVWVETELCQNFTQLAHQICVSLNPALSNHPTLVSQDEYLIKSLLETTVKKHASNIVLVLTFGRISTKLFKDTEYQIALMQKGCPNLKSLWSLDSFAYRNYHPSHPACIAIESVFNFPTFTAEETIHSMRRIAISKGKDIASLVSRGFDLSGGVAGLLPGLVYEGEAYLSRPQAEEIVGVLRQELTLSPELSLPLSTPYLREFLAGQTGRHYSYKNLKLKAPPSAQELVLLKLLTEKQDQPVTRDELAQVLWGKLWQEKYSDWAIDKAVSRLRQNLASATHRLITVRNLGYSLVCRNYTGR